MGDNLAWKLAAVLRGQAPRALLDSFQDERHEAALENLRVSDRTARFMRASTRPERAYRDAVLALARRRPFARALVNTGRMAVANRYTRSRVCGPGGGITVQNVALQRADGRRGVLNDLLPCGGDGVLLLCLFDVAEGPHRAALTSRLALHPVRGIDVRSSTAPGSGDDILDPDGLLRRACQMPDAAGWALLRPDAYAAAVGTWPGDDPLPAVVRTLSRVLPEATP